MRIFADIIVPAGSRVPLSDTIFLDTTKTKAGSV